MRAITFVVFGMLLTYIVAEPGGGRKLLSMSLSLEQVACQPNGCSIPLNLISSFHYYKMPFRPACNKHDICYACGFRNGWGRHDCDVAFHQDMLNLCKYHDTQCRSMAFDYYNAVRRFGKNHYKIPSLDWCHSCPKSKGDPFLKILGREFRG